MGSSGNARASAGSTRAFCLGSEIVRVIGHLKHFGRARISRFHGLPGQLEFRSRRHGRGLGLSRAGTWAMPGRGLGDARVGTWAMPGRDLGDAWAGTWAMLGRGPVFLGRGPAFLGTWSRLLGRGLVFSILGWARNDLACFLAQISLFELVFSLDSKIA
ncbi:unnamed protein product [Rhodiola kirilowii]